MPPTYYSNAIMTKTVAIFLGFLTLIFTSSCLDNVNDNPNSRSPEKEKRELDDALASYIEDGWDIDTTELGVYYIVHEEGEGPLVQEGDSLSLEYNGYTLGGMIFDATAYHFEDKTWEFIFDASQLIPGFSDGLLLMNEGAILDIIIPSEYAYGEQGNGLIEPFSTIRFTMKLHELITSDSIQARFTVANTYSIP